MTDITASGPTSLVALSAGSAGIGISGNPLVISSPGLTTNSAANNGPQFMSAVGVTTVGANDLSAGTASINLTGGRFNTLTGGNNINSNVVVENAATLGGTGTVAGTVLVNGGGTVSPGTSPGIVSTGSVTMTPSSKLDIEVLNSTVGTGHDQLKVTGTVNLGGATLNVNAIGATLTPGVPLVIVDNDDTDAVTGTFAGLPEGAAVLGGVGGPIFQISYKGGTGNDVVLNWVYATITKNDSFVQEDLATKVYPNNGQFTVSLNIPVPIPMSIPYNFTGVANSENPDDYYPVIDSSKVPMTGTLTIPANTTDLVVNVLVNDDLLYDGPIDEDVTLTITGPSTSTPNTATMKIVDNEAAPTLSIAATKGSAAEPGTDGEFTVTLSGPTDSATTVNLNYTSPGNPASIAVNVSDYNAPGSVTIAATTTTAIATVAVVNDTLVEGSETVKATLGTIVTGPGVTVGSPNNATVTIADDDAATVSIGPFSAASVSEAGGVATAVISQSAPSSTATVVKYNLLSAPGTKAVEGVDYTLGIVDEVESSNTIFGPQPLASKIQGLAGFSLADKTPGFATLGDIVNAATVPHLTVNSTANDGSADVFAFYTDSGGSATFDIDNAGAFNSFLEVFKADGTLLDRMTTPSKAQVLVAVRVRTRSMRD